MTLRDYLKEQVSLVDAELDRLVPSESTPPQTIHRAMRYSLFAGGKRIRPILCMEAARTVSDHTAGIETAACALEMVHTYSLIHDDLPALDNDDLRRGKPTSHKVFGEAMAILAGDALLTFAFDALSSASSAPLERRAVMVRELAVAAGTPVGMVAGQVEDLEGEYKTPEPELLSRIHRAKTGALIRVSLRIGAIYAGADEVQLDALSRYGEHIGLAFQIVDDLLDIEQSSEALGKTAGKDAEQHKITFPAVYGTEESHRMAEAELAGAQQALEMFGPRAERLRELAGMIVHRKA
jgi:geranylgeranyl diphosphate synthase type II